jgi:hypothetical protein
LSIDETSRALRIGATLVLTPSYTNAVAGATALNVAGGMVASLASSPLTSHWLVLRHKTMPSKKHSPAW